MRVRGWLLSLPPVALSAVLFAATPAQAGTIFSDFGAGNAYNCCSGWTTSGATSGVGLVSSAMDFTPGGNYTLTQIDVAIGYVLGTNGVTLDLETSAAGVPSGIIMESWNVTGLPTFGTCCAIETVTPTLQINLLAGTQYWLVAVAPSDTWDAWNFNSIGETGNLAQNSGSGWNLFPGQSQGAFDVQGTSSTPEPTTALFAAAGLGLLAVIRRKRS